MSNGGYEYGYYWVRYCPDNGPKEDWEIAEHFFYGGFATNDGDFSSAVELSEKGYELGPRAMPPPEDYSAKAV